MTKNTQFMRGSDSMEILNNIFVTDGAVLITEAAAAWTHALVPHDNSIISEQVRSFVKARRRPEHQAELDQWSADQYWEALFGAFHRSMADLRITEVRPRRTFQPVRYSDGERQRRAALLADLAQPLSIPEGFAFFERVVTQWATTYDFDTLRQLIASHDIIPDETWTDQKYSEYIPYLIAGMTEH